MHSPPPLSHNVTMLTTANQRKENTTNCLENLKKMMGVTKLASHSGEGGGGQCSFFWGGWGGTKNYALNPRHTMKQGWFNKSNHLLFQTTKEFKQMVSLLIHTVKTQSPELAFHAAVSLGRLCVVEPVSKMYLITRLPGLSPRDKGEVRVRPLNFLCIKSNYWITHRNMWIGILKLWNSRM